MHQRQIEARPIRLIGGSSSFCETFFTDATAPKSALLGKLNEGWSVGKRLLQHERASQTGEATGERAAPLEEIAKRYVALDGQGRIVDRDLRLRITRNVMDAQAHRLTLARAVAEAKGASSVSNAASVLKNAATSVAQTRTELLLEIMGNRALGWDGEGFTKAEIETTRGWLMGKAMSIYGGSVEIQNNIIAKRILGLSDRTAD
jgi:alkylation response protein AidB-like acyl-CoA dehydrogenase